ncbi:raffinose/stachyose/melibiose transport system substrate-binding protein [Paenibacillus rhizosphaerae]|uniref:Raffinose/stachyose/melibiose transport system substrate-binding protein n=1 Tax=Paenibacillus rhizosphaerae TaxID=297318 RepID=A0A839TXZ9_9BACL|nr:ABC transporter substrate-binding protein [Paenibacillus rhizosphaerae]MBB3130278.1 raffinose/stachyose/melibiose transport system substrate-binding protein [Paenibacillus rhizosphaerae]
MKKRTKMALASVLALSVVLAGCGSKTDKSAEGASGGTKTIHIFQFKVEIAEALNKLKADYEASHPGVKLDIQTVGGGSDYGAALKAKFASGEEPDIFNVGGYTDLDTWQAKLEDLSGEKWVGDMVDVAKDQISKDGKVYGMPMNLEGYGFVYNKDLFKKAGITDVPKTLTELEAAAKKLQDAGITPFVNGYQEGWILGQHSLNVAFAHQKDPGAFIEGLNNGTAKFAGNEQMEQFMNLFDLTLKYSNKNPLTTDYNTEMTMFANGQAAMTQQGNWTQVQIDGITPNMNIGILPMPINDNAAENDKLLVGVPNNWVINKNSKVKDDAKEFLNWLVTSDEGKNYITKEFKFIPAFKSINATEEDLGALGAEVLNYSKENKLLSWQFARFPEGAWNEFGASMQAYIAGKTDKAKLLEDFQNTWDNLKK